MKISKLEINFWGNTNRINTYTLIEIVFFSYNRKRNRLWALDLTLFNQYFAINYRRK